MEFWLHHQACVSDQVGRTIALTGRCRSTGWTDSPPLQMPKYRISINFVINFMSIHFNVTQITSNFSHYFIFALVFSRGPQVLKNDTLLNEKQCIANHA